MASRLLQEMATVVQGALIEVDTINREILVQINGATMAFDVPTDCTILLNRECVKLRLLQSTDRVSVTFRDQDGRHRARVIEV